MVTEEVALAMSRASLELEVYEVDRETQEETLQETIAIDLSPLLFPKNLIDVSLFNEFA